MIGWLSLFGYRVVIGIVLIGGPIAGGAVRVARGFRRDRARWDTQYGGYLKPSERGEL